jgi:hypothetical protein
MASSCLATILRWRCTICGVEGGFSYISSDFAKQVMEAQRRGHLQSKPICALGKFEVLP